MKKIVSLMAAAVVAAAAFTAGPIAVSAVAPQADVGLAKAEAGGYCAWKMRWVVFGHDRFGRPMGAWVLQRVWVDVGGPGGAKRC